MAGGSRGRSELAVGQLRCRWRLRTTLQPTCLPRVRQNVFEQQQPEATHCQCPLIDTGVGAVSGVRQEVQNETVFASPPTGDARHTPEKEL